MPISPAPSRWAFPRSPAEVAAVAGGQELVAVGADLEAGTLLAAYRAGMFPMPAPRRQLGWWSPDPRGVIPLDGLRVSRSLRRSAARYEARVDTAFASVVAGCADQRRRGAWIDARFVAAYTRLHELGWAHSVEAWDDDGLAGGLYGVAIGGLFAGESMFHRRTDASKVALLALVERLRAGRGLLLDVQWATEHLRSLGAVEVSREEYHRRLETAVADPQLDLASPASPRPRPAATKDFGVGC